MKFAALAALATSLACYPRLALWGERVYPLWFLEVSLFCCTIVMWAFVFGWHTQYSQRPVLTVKLSPSGIVSAIAAGTVVATVLCLFFDPTLRTQFPQEYPASYRSWLATTLFGLALQPLFLVFAPFAFFIRLFRSERTAVILAVVFMVLIGVFKAHSASATLPSAMAVGYLLLRIIAGLLSLHFYLRGGMLLMCCWGLPIQLRYLTEF